jgi:hypothetical protein
MIPLITIPLNLAWFILIVSTAVIILIVVTTIETNRWHSRALRRKLRRYEQDLDDRAVGLLEFSASLMGREELVYSHELRLRRAAYDMKTQANMALHQAADDTEIMMPDWEKWSSQS